MPRAPAEQHDLDLVAARLAERRVRAERFTDAEVKAGKTPDFRLFRDGHLVGYCEVKSPRDEWLDDLLKNAAPFQIAGGLRDDPTFSRIAGLVRKAVKQLDAVNPDRRLPNVLAFVNWANGNHFRDLDETLTGHVRLADGGKVPTMIKIAEGRMRDEKLRIDAYVWFDGQWQKAEGIFFTQSNLSHCDAVCSWFNVDPSKIRI